MTARMPALDRNFPPGPMTKKSSRGAAPAGRAPRREKPVDGFQGRQQRPEDVIIDATVACFNRFGVRKTSMEDIAEVAKLSRPTIYRYFPTRSHLIVEVLLREVRDHTRLVVPVIKQHRYPPRALIEGITFDIATAQRHPYTSIVVSEAGNEMLTQVSGSDEILLEAMAEQWLPALNRWREEGYLRAELKMDDVVLWITLIIHHALKPSWISVPPSKMRRILATLVVPAIFDMEHLRADFPRDSIDDLVADGEPEPVANRRSR